MTSGDSYVLDSFALLAYLGDEAGAGTVQAILAEAEKRRVEVWMCILNIGEVLYITERARSLEAAQRVAALIDQLPIQVVEADRSLTYSAAHVKAHHSLSYADAFAVALAREVGATVVTGDREFRQVDTLVPVWWI